MMRRRKGLSPRLTRRASTNSEACGTHVSGRKGLVVQARTANEPDSARGSPFGTGLVAGCAKKRAQVPKDRNGYARSSTFLAASSTSWAVNSRPDLWSVTARFMAFSTCRMLPGQGMFARAIALRAVTPTRTVGLDPVQRKSGPLRGYTSAGGPYR